MGVVSVSIETIIKTFHEVGSVNKTARLLKKQERYIARRLDQAGIARKKAGVVSLCVSCGRGYAHLCEFIATESKRRMKERSVGPNGCEIY
ncbi:MAG: hypothetical protein HQP61_02270 [Peptococcaceae bacterium]|nr:hypothetical protein [Candidatus Syntrophopropionicum ammoniitolerans]